MGNRGSGTVDRFGLIILVLLGLGFCIYCGIVILLPLSFGMLAYVLLRAWRPLPGALTLAAAATISQFFWFLIAAVSLGAGWRAVAVDLAATFLLAVWLVLKPRRLPSALLIPFELYGLLINGIVLYVSTAGSPAFKAVLAQMGLRVLIILSASVFLIAKTREEDVGPPRLLKDQR